MPLFTRLPLRGLLGDRLHLQAFCPEIRAKKVESAQGMVACTS